MRDRMLITICTGDVIANTWWLILSTWNVAKMPLKTVNPEEHQHHSTARKTPATRPSTHGMDGQAVARQPEDASHASLLGLAVRTELLASITYIKRCTWAMRIKTTEGQIYDSVYLPTRSVGVEVFD